MSSPAIPATVQRQPNGRCTSCLRTGSDITIAMAKVHGPVLLCERCRDFCETRGWLRS